MASATVTSKGQVTIPVDVRRDMGITAGTRLDFIPNGDGSYRVARKAGSVMDMFGMLRHDGPPVPVEEMDEAIAAALAERHDRISREHL
ncbi:MAG: AbrB/MazE/SpoVT family DNA-binding domain-containing protein [Coriobacteriales bacterium]|nr:AbrB/MazE/SpoVT family DNA-binding domain-containing protein [Coriobacteriales bacterium]